LFCNKNFHFEGKTNGGAIMNSIKNQKTMPNWVKGVFINGKWKQYKNRNAFDALGRVMGGISIEQADKMGLLDPTSLKDK
jgi:hypothetical protein